MRLRNESLSRRAFLGGSLATAGALVLGVGWARADEDEQPARGAGPWSPSIWLTIAPSGAVTIVAHRSEMGTGIRTSLPLVLADELEADWAKVTIEQAIGDARFGSQNTDGSRSIRRFFTGMRQAGAAARQMLVAAAARRWGVPEARCKAVLHEVVGPGDRRLGYGALVGEASALPVPTADQLVLKPRAAWRYIGKDGAASKAIVDEQAIVSGKAVFGLDVDLPDQLVAVIARSPVLGGAPAGFDEAAARKLPGVVDVVTLPTFKPPHGFQALGGVAVLARTTWPALRGRDAVAATIRWTQPPGHAGYASPAFEKQLTASARGEGGALKTVRARGAAGEALAAAPAGRRLVADYHCPHLAHASMEPPCAVARMVEIEDQPAVEVWAPTQNPQAAQEALAAALGLPKERCVVHVTLLGGGFGRKSKPDYIVEAALLARATRKPVKVVWTREDDIRHDYLHSVASMRCEAAWDAGKVTAWRMTSAFPTIMSTFAPKQTYGSDLELGLGVIPFPYAIPNIAMRSAPAEAHVRIGWLRAVANVYHAFAICSFTDELAHAMKQDPRDALLAMIGAPRKVDPNGEGMAYHNHKEPLERFPIDTGRLRAVTELVARKAGWGRELGPRRGLGIAAHRSFLSYVAVVAEVAVSEDGALTIPEVHIALDCGTIVNPDRVRSQMEGSVIFGASLAMMGEITVEGGAVVQGNFNDYPVCRMHDAPRAIHVHLVDSEELPAGVGEPGVPPVAPAITNAIFAATGKRIRRLPINRHDLSAT